MEQNRQYVCSKTLGRLINESFELATCYTMLLNARNGNHRYEPFKNSNNKTTSGYRLLSKRSNVSYSALKKYVPRLVELNLCRFDSDGGFFMCGLSTVQKQSQNKVGKVVPVKINKNLRATVANVKAVVIIANLWRQQNKIVKNQTLYKAIKASKTRKLSKPEYLAIKNAVRKGICIEEFKMVEKTVLSNIRIALLLRGTLNSSSVSVGSYWRKKLVNAEYISSNRRFEDVYDHRVTYAQYCAYKPQLQEIYGFVTYFRGKIVRPLASYTKINTTIYSNL